MRPAELDTIVAVSTAPGAALRAIIRLSGSRAQEAVESVFTTHSGSALSSHPSFSRILGALTIEEGLVAEAALYIMRAPHSYTREDVVEIHTIGSPPLVGKLLRVLQDREDVRPATPGEFTRQAFVNGRLDLVQAEAVLQIIEALSDAELRTAFRRLQGGWREDLDGLNREILELVSLLEACIDFPEVSDAFIRPSHVAMTLEHMAGKVDAIREEAEKKEISREGAHVVLWGAPNVGKSSIFNRLLRREKAIVHPAAGTTRDPVKAHFQLRQTALCLIDPPGLRAPECEIEHEALKRGRSELDSADLVLFVMDATRPPGEEDLRRFAEISDRKRLVVLNKIDASVHPHRFRGKPWDREEVRLVSAMTGEGISGLETSLVRVLRTTPPPSGCGWNARQAATLRRAARSIRRALDALKEGLGYEFVSADMRDAMNALGELVGKLVTEDILDRIFARFCIGK
jgi:tRNA modification GTPase